MVDEDGTGRDKDRPVPPGRAEAAPEGRPAEARAERLAAFDHIAGLTEAFAEVARRRNFRTLAHLLEMAQRQARQDASSLRAQAAGGAVD